MLEKQLLEVQRELYYSLQKGRILYNAGVLTSRTRKEIGPASFSLARSFEEYGRRNIRTEVINVEFELSTRALSIQDASGYRHFVKNMFSSIVNVTKNQFQF